MGRVKGGTKAFRQRSRSEARATMRRVRQDESRGSSGSANQWCCESEEARAGRANRRSLYKAAAASTGFDKTLSPARKNRGKWLSAAFRGLSAPSRLTLLFITAYLHCASSLWFLAAICAAALPPQLLTACPYRAPAADSSYYPAAVVCGIL